jgi:hypothetical protein
MGGSFEGDANFLRAADRAYNLPDNSAGVRGFRCAR